MPSTIDFEENLKRLEFIVMHQVVNMATVTILEQACPGLPGVSGRYFKFMPGDDSFSAIMATPVGRLAARLVRDYYESIGRKDFGRLTVWYGKTDSWCFMYRLEEEKVEPKIKDLKHRQKVDLGLVQDKGHKKGMSTGSIASPKSGGKHRRNASAV